MAHSTPSPLERENSCTFLRLFFSLAVVCGHASVLGGFGPELLERLSGGAASGREIAVQGFFVLSGFLIAKSLGENPSLWRFACHRAFRIYPAFWLYLVGTVFVLAPVMLHLGWPGRFTYWEMLAAGPKPAWNYFAQNWGLQAREFLIVPLFPRNPEAFQVNGSLWSVRYEATLYLCAAAAAAAWQLPRRAAGLAAMLALVVMLVTGWLAAGFATVAFLWRVLLPRGHGLLTAFVTLFACEFALQIAPAAFAWMPRSLAVAGFLLEPVRRISTLAFLGGMLLWRYRAHLRWDARLFAIAAAVLVAGVWFKRWHLAMPLALPYAVLFLAARLPFQKVERWGDFSYGIYIFSFPIQQLLAHFGLHRAGFAAYLAGSVVLSIAAGMLSWWLVEKPALRLGRKLGAWQWPGRNAVPETSAPVSLPAVG